MHGMITNSGRVITYFFSLCTSILVYHLTVQAVLGDNHFFNIKMSKVTCLFAFELMGWLLRYYFFFIYNVLIKIKLTSRPNE